MNYPRYVEAKRDPEKSKRNLQAAMYARMVAAIGEAEFESIECSHYRSFQKRFGVAVLLGLSFGTAGLAYLLT